MEVSDLQPVIYAAIRNSSSTRVLEALIAAGVKVNKAYDLKSYSPLMYAIAEAGSEYEEIPAANTAIINTLISAGADVNARSGRHLTTPLIAAIRRAKPGIVRILVAAGADINMRTKEGETPLDVARRLAKFFRKDINEMNEIIRILKPTDERLNIPVTDRNFNAGHDTDPVSLEDIKEGDEYYMMNENVNPYMKGTMKYLLQSNNPISPTTRQPIRTITKHKRPATSGGRKRTKKHRKSKRKTRSSRK
jgi:ankyrin repeat protein